MTQVDVARHLRHLRLVGPVAAGFRRAHLFAEAPRVVPGPHCETCAAYEDRVIGRKDGEVLPPEVAPCKDFQMSDRFREWAVAEMRREVLGQVKAAGLDRMALLKGKKDGAGRS